MAGLRGNNAYWGIQVQSGKLGTAAAQSAATTLKLPFSGGDLSPEREIAQLSETDASRNVGVSYVKGSGIKGNPETYVRDTSVVPLLAGVLGGQHITLTLAVEGSVATGVKTVLKIEGFGNSSAAGVEALVAQKIKSITNGGTILAATPESYNAGTKELKFTGNLSGTELTAKTEVKFEIFTHEIEQSANQAYYTLWGAISEKVYESYFDCYINGLEIKASAGSPLTAQADIVGRGSELLASDPLPSPTYEIQKGTVYNFNNLDNRTNTTAGIKIGTQGTVNHFVSSMTLNIQNNVTKQQTDSVVPIDVASGKVTVGCSFDLIFTSGAGANEETAYERYEKFMYESAGSKKVISNTIYTEALKFTYVLDALHVIEFNIPNFAYEEFPIQPEVQGAPIVVAVKGSAQRPASGINMITATVKNGQEKY